MDQGIEQIVRDMRGRERFYQFREFFKQIDLDICRVPVKLMARAERNHLDSHLHPAHRNVLGNARVSLYIAFGHIKHLAKVLKAKMLAVWIQHNVPFLKLLVNGLE